MKIKFLYKQKIMAKQYFQDKNDIDSDFKLIAFPAFLIILNLLSFHLFLAIFSPEYRMIYSEVKEFFNIPKFIVFIVFVSFIYIFVGVVSGKNEWKEISIKDKKTNKSYIIFSMVLLPVLCISAFFI